MFKVNNKDTRTTPLVFLLLTLSGKMLAGLALFLMLMLFFHLPKV